MGKLENVSRTSKPKYPLRHLHLRSILLRPEDTVLRMLRSIYQHQRRETVQYHMRCVTLAGRVWVPWVRCRDGALVEIGCD